MPSPKGQLTNYIREWWPLTEAFAKSNLTSNQHRIIKGLQFLSYKWRMAEATASYRDLSEVTGIPRTKVGLYLKPLIEMKVVLEIKKPQGVVPGIYKINKDIRMWDKRALDINLISSESMKLVEFECLQSSDSHQNRDSLQNGDSHQDSDSYSLQSGDNDSHQSSDTSMPTSVDVERAGDAPKEIFKEIDKEINIHAAVKKESTYGIQVGIQEAAATANPPPFLDISLSKVLKYAESLYPAQINTTQAQEFSEFLNDGLSPELIMRGIKEMRLDNKPWRWLFAKLKGQLNDGIRTVEDAERWEEKRRRQHYSSNQWNSRQQQIQSNKSSKYDVFYQHYQSHT